MLKKIFNIIFSHFADNTLYYFIALSSVAFGCVMGAVGGSGYVDGGFLSDFFGGLDSFSASGLMSRGIVQAAALSGIVFVFGISPAGIVLIPLCNAYKGFAFGFSAAAMNSVYGLKSAAFVILGLIPSAVIWLPALVFASVNGIKTSVALIRIFKKQGRADLRFEAFTLVLSTVLTFAALIISKLVEIYIVPQMLNLVGGLYI